MRDARWRGTLNSRKLESHTVPRHTVVRYLLLVLCMTPRHPGFQLAKSKVRHSSFGRYQSASGSLHLVKWYSCAGAKTFFGCFSSFFGSYFSVVCIARTSFSNILQYNIREYLPSWRISAPSQVTEVNKQACLCHGGSLHDSLIFAGFIDLNYGTFMWCIRMDT